MDKKYGKNEPKDLEEQNLFEKMNPEKKQKTNPKKSKPKPGKKEQLGKKVDHIDKTKCQRCEFFSKPPHVKCLKNGAKIIQIQKINHFKVKNCPKT